ncbi:L-type lectin-domain containing receptor kinase IX.1 [Thalictrum thalictroides]|uniref:non-specific serine/threonine protein kinase n=1 Tax=Thalictrum thalictroides TaxID=46969 RepID=A0A7J6V4K9_THATH|nr:L-type lectin-domain containing receptor kinase IX.1 [Thalictrum thalictroides]
MAHFLIFLTFFLLQPSDSLKFKLPRFDPNSKEILYEGDAVPTVGAIEFNKVNYLCRVGRATYAERAHIWDSDSGTLADFTTHFSFFIDTQGAKSYGHGLAFFLAPVGFQIPPNSNGGFLGLFNTTTSDASSRNQIITVEFDSFPNSEWDPPYEHVGINNNSIASVRNVRWNASSHSGDTANVWITYNATTKNLSVYWSYELNPVFRGESLLSYQVDLMKVLPEWVTVGFSAATGQFVQRHNLKSWEFDSSLNIKVTKGKNEQKTRLIVGLVVSFGILIGGVGIVSVILWRRRRMQRAMYMEGHGITGDFERGAGPKKFTYRELVSATNNFSDDRKLGEGGFGCVYRGFLSYLDLAIAVKKISRGSRQGKKEYITEVKTISQLRHRNLVQLMGWCHDKGEFLLVYEFMPNGSLDAHIFGKTKQLTWAVRYKIALGIASAILYLHEEWEQCVIHRDIKSSNVMLDSSFNAKLGDFGLARLMDHELGPQTTGLAGTLGYLAPEYISTGKASKESDVYSFGVVALEIACGRKSTNPLDEESEMGLVEWVWDLYGKGRLLSAVDEKLFSVFDVKQVECLMITGLWCAHPDHSSRPSIRQAIQILNFESKMPDLPPTMPVPLYHVPAGLLNSSEPSITSSSLEVGR